MVLEDLSRKGEEEDKEGQDMRVRIYKLKTVIAKDQKEYIEEVREWLHNGLKGKGKIVGGPYDKSKNIESRLVA